MYVNTFFLQKNLFLNAAHQQATECDPKILPDRYTIGAKLVRQYGVRFDNPKFGIICTKYMRVNLPSLSRFFFSPTLQIIRVHLALLLSGRLSFYPLVTFKPIDSEILKVTFSCLKNIVVWNTCVIKEPH